VVFLLKKSTIPTFCANCNLFTVCQGDCRGASEQLGYTIEKGDPIIELMNRKD